MTFFLIIVLLLGGGAYGAEVSLPGDVLYPAKLSVIENVRSAIAFSAEDRAFWTAQKVNRRFEEVEELITKKRLDNQTWSGIKATIVGEIADVNEWTETFKGRHRYATAADTTFNLETVFLAHKELLADLKTGLDETTGADLDQFLLNQTQAVAVARAELQELFRTEIIGFEAQAAANEKIINTNAEITAMKKRLDKNAKNIPEALLKKIEALVAAGDASLSEAQTQIKEEKYNQTFITAETAFRAAHTADTFISASHYFSKAEN